MKNSEKSLKIIAILMICALAAGCGGASKKSDNATEPAMASMDMANSAARQNSLNVTFNETVTATGSAANSKGAANTSTGNAGGSSQVLPDQRKKVTNGTLTVEVKNFDEAYASLRQMVSVSGYVQETSVKKDRVWENGREVFRTRGTIILRIEAARFDKLFSDARSIGVVTDENIRTDDISDRFFDTEGRLNVLKIEREKIEDYLKSVKDPDTVFKTRQRLSEIMLEIENLTSTLRKWQGLVDLATLTVTLTETPSQMAPSSDTFGGRFWQTLSGSFQSAGNLILNLVLFTAAVLPLIIFLLLAGVVVVLTLRRRRRHARNASVPLTRWQTVPPKAQEILKDEEDDTTQEP